MTYPGSHYFFSILLVGIFVLWVFLETLFLQFLKEKPNSFILNFSLSDIPQLFNKKRCLLEIEKVLDFTLQEARISFQNMQAGLLNPESTQNFFLTAIEYYRGWHSDYFVMFHEFFNTIPGRFRSQQVASMNAIPRLELQFLLTEFEQDIQALQWVRDDIQSFPIRKTLLSKIKRWLKK